eukprot:COSAG04_NODE_794_length_10264_cov_35.102804_10_plen_51_part_00
MRRLSLSLALVLFQGYSQDPGLFVCLFLQSELLGRPLASLPLLSTLNTSD